MPQATVRNASWQLTHERESSQPVGNFVAKSFSLISGK
jgi:hypothetical protein